MATEAAELFDLFDVEDKPRLATPPASNVLIMADYPTDTVQPWIDDDGFLRARTGTAHRTTATTENAMRNAAALAASGPKQAIWDVRGFTSVDMDAWLVFLDWLPTVVSALAMVVSDDTMTQALTFQEEINRLLVPCRLFEDDESAVAWLKSLET